VDREIWMVLQCAARIVARRLPKPQRRCRFSDRQIILMWLWAALHDRPLCWACRRENCRGPFRPRSLPSVSQFCKRLAAPRFELARRRLHELLAARGREDLLNFIDGKPLVIQGYSTDPDARNGIACGKYAFGYKLHARVTGSGFLAEYAVLPLHEGEPNTARSLLEHVTPGVLMLADANYDSGPLYEAVAARGATLLTRPKGQHLRRPGSQRRTPPARQEALETWRTQPRCCEQAMHLRDGIERVFARLGNFGGGLGPLPAWVRRLPRVRRWVDAKIAIYHARLLAKACLNAA
jgi:hypothetical protein